MAAEQQAMAEIGVQLPSESAPHEMRITQGGKIHAWVEFALKFFEENEEKALVLHTLPAPAGKVKSKKNERVEVATGDGNESQDAPQPPQEIDLVGQEKREFSTSTTTIPRLISVVEIIKREYLVAMGARRSPDLVGLYQYNEMGSLEDQVENEREGREESAGDRVKMITEALSGTKNVRVARSPYMKITLCRKELTGMKERGATVQAQLKRKLSKSAKMRLKKRLRKSKGGGDESENELRTGRAES